MTTLRCVCGAVVEGTEEALLEAVERHVCEVHGQSAKALYEEDAAREAAEIGNDDTGGRNA